MIILGRTCVILKNNQNISFANIDDLEPTDMDDLDTNPLSLKFFFHVNNSI